ncbi:putative phage tail protein [Paenibacillus polymyxa]|uniref:putative phage tail protein n=1 Tax=Paenibacillus polymyxa TaxID=1406 RepID=UPI0029C090BE|nr:putative phage tail protein [Paenibacillus polymyxa]
MRTATEIARTMRDYLPRYYEESLLAGNLINREADELARIDAAVYDVLDQFFIGTATWGLARWETMFGVPTDTTKTYEQRREVLCGKLRGSGKVTAELIRNVAAAYANGEVAVSADVPRYTVIIKFIGVFGVPSQIEELKATLRDIVPAHLAIEYNLRYLTIAEVEAMTIYENEHTTQDKYLGGGA